MWKYYLWDSETHSEVTDNPRVVLKNVIALTRYSCRAQSNYAWSMCITYSFQSMNLCPPDTCIFAREVIESMSRGIAVLAELSLSVGEYSLASANISEGIRSQRSAKHRLCKMHWQRWDWPALALQGAVSRYGKGCSVCWQCLLLQQLLPLCGEGVVGHELPVGPCWHRVWHRGCSLTKWLRLEGVSGDRLKIQVLDGSGSKLSEVGLVWFTKLVPLTGQVWQRHGDSILCQFFSVSAVVD